MNRPPYSNVFLLLIIKTQLHPVKQNMAIIKKIVCLLLVLHITYSLDCLYNTESSCIANGCYWGDGFCAVSSSITNCLDGFYYQISVNDTGCIPCTSLDNSTCSIDCPDYDFVPGLGCVPCTLIDINCISCQFIQSAATPVAGGRRLQTTGVNTCKLCKVGYVLNPNDPTNCIPVPCSILNCLTCETNSTCGICQTGYFVCQNGTTCCPYNCTVANCKVCLTTLNCGPCQDGYTNNCDNTACVPVCPTNCGTCTTPNSCAQCLSGYVFSSTLGYCVLMCQVQYCATCASSTTCSSCISGYYVAPCGTCCLPNSVPNCMIPSSPTCCQTCNPGYIVLANGTCGPAICYITNCLVCSSCTTCSQCNSITSLNSNGTSCIFNCLSVVPNCVSCSSNTTCQGCAPGYLMSSGNKCNPACTIANCAVCLTSGICQYCKSNFTLTCTGTCTINCGIPNCVTCNSSTTCQTCATNYQRSVDCTQCILVCTPGNYIATAVNGTQTCQLCSLTIPNCYLCATTQFTINPLTCLACWDFYYINGAGFCTSCSDAIPNCLTCNSLATCTQCAKGYILYTNLIGATFCELIGPCRVANCYYCAPTNSQICTTCQKSFQRSSDGLSCSLIDCIGNQIYDPVTNQCLCPIGTYLVNSACNPCKFKNCLACNAAGCNTCAASYFLSGNTCKSCPIHCISCTSSTTCTQCAVDYTLSGTTCVSSCGCSVGILITGTGTLQLCPAGCASCSISQGTIYCVNPSPGYSFGSAGDIIKCNSPCLTCARANYTICTSCPGASILYGTTCVGCVDLYAASCSPSTLSTGCIPGYSVFNGTCQACDPNCIYCGNSGPGNCDYDQCNSGYVIVEGTTNCTACFNGCSSCHQNNPGLCLSCAGADYLDNSSICQPCPSICLTCLTDTICNSCYPGFTLLGDGKCYNYIGYPCYKQLQDKCVACYPSYKLDSSSNCVINITCNSNSSCKSCPIGYFLNKKKCVRCQTNSLCAFCDPKQNTSCLTCISGYYIDSSSNNCYTCNSSMPGCLNCTSDYNCTHADKGYYVQVDVNGFPTGVIKPCLLSCDTCVSLTCLTCAASYTRFGSFCLYEQYVSGTITLGPGPGTDWFTYSTSSQQTLAYAVANSGQIIAAILALSGLSISQFDSILLKSVGLGSLIVDYSIGVRPEILSVQQLNNNLQTGTIPDFNTLSHSTSINAKSTTNDGNGSGANLGLILGITIPLVILLVVVIVFIKIYSSDTDEKETEETDKGVNEYEM